MKQANVRVGMVVTTRIGAERCDVVVVAEVPGDPNAYWKDEKRTSFRVRRVGETVNLPKRRSAAALCEK